MTNSKSEKDETDDKDEPKRELSFKEKIKSINFGSVPGGHD